MKIKKKADKKLKKGTLEDLQEDLNKYCTDKLWNYTNSWKEMKEEVVSDLVWHGTNIIWLLHQRDTIKFCVNIDEIAEEFRCKFGDKYNLACTCKECQVKKTGEELEEEKKLKTNDDFENDFEEYASVRLKGWGGRDEFIIGSLIRHFTHIFWTFNFEDSILMFLIIDGFMTEFMEENGDKYHKTCECCSEKIERGELREANIAN